MNTTLISENEHLLQALLHPGEELIWLGHSLSVDTPTPPSSGRFWQRLRAWCSQSPSPLPRVSEPCLYILTTKRVLHVQNEGIEHEWPLMLGMVQNVEIQQDSSGSIIFDYSQADASSPRQPCGILHVVDVASVHARLTAAIDAAYLASPWT